MHPGGMAERSRSSGLARILERCQKRRHGLPIGTAYAIWTGIGAAGTVVCGIFVLGDPATIMRLVCVGLILAGVIGLKVAQH